MSGGTHSSYTTQSQLDLHRQRWHGGRRRGRQIRRGVDRALEMPPPRPLVSPPGYDLPLQPEKWDTPLVPRPGASCCQSPGQPCLYVPQQISNVVFMLGQRLRCWPNMKTTLGHVSCGLGFVRVTSEYDMLIMCWLKLGTASQMMAWH